MADQAAFERRFGCVLTEGYGSSEGGVAISRGPDTPAGSLGRPTGDVVVLDPDTLLSAPRAVRCLRSPRQRRPGRRRDRDRRTVRVASRATTPTPRPTPSAPWNGWYWTGDLAYRDEAGFFYFAGRRGDWMRVDSENLTAGPIERVLNRFDDVATVAVYSVPDPRSGDQVMAALEMLPGPGLSTPIGSVVCWPTNPISAPNGSRPSCASPGACPRQPAARVSRAPFGPRAVGRRGPGPLAPGGGAEVRPDGGGRSSSTASRVRAARTGSTSSVGEPPPRTPGRPAGSPSRRSGALATAVDGLDRWQQRHRLTAVPSVVVRKYSEDQAGRLSAQISYAAFLAVFPCCWCC